MKQSEAMLLAELIRLGLTSAFTAMQMKGMSEAEREELYNRTYAEFKKRKPEDLPDA